MALAELDLSRYDLPPKPRLAVVGTPCEIQGIRAMQARRWPTGAHRIDAVVLTIALLCTKSFDYEALMLRELRDQRGVDLDRVSKVDVIHGRMIVEYRDGSVAVDEPVKDFHGAALKGCDECADFLGRSADLSIGSVGSMAGLVERPGPDRGRPSRLRPGPGPPRRPRPRRPRGAASGSTTWTSGSPSGRCSASSTPTRRCSSTTPSTSTLRGHRPRPGGDPPVTATAPRARRLHVPDEPVDRKLAWRDAVLDGEDLAERGRADPGAREWLWESLAGAGHRAGMGAGRARRGRRYRREIWFWLIGDRTWEQCCAGPARPRRAAPGA